MIPVLAGVVFAVAAIRGYIVNAHFERGSRDTKAVVLEVSRREVKSGFRRVGNRYVRTGPSRTERKIRYEYRVVGVSYTGSFTTGKPMPRPVRVGDSIRIRYAADKPSLSRAYVDRLR